MTAIAKSTPDPIPTIAMQLRKGRTLWILQSAVEAATTAVEIYNKPRGRFRTQGFVSLMVIAWTRLFHAYLRHEIGDRYYYKKSNKRYVRVDGERKAWDLATCIKKYDRLPAAVRKNLEFAILLRNKVEHRHVDSSELDALTFGEMQALLYNFEVTLANLFGTDHAMSSSLVYSLQFSQLRTGEQILASKSMLTAGMEDLREFVKTFRESVSDEVYQSQDYSVRLIQIPKVSNSDRADAAVEFVRYSDLSDEEKEEYSRLVTLIKDKVVKVAVNAPGQLKASNVIQMVSERIGDSFSHHAHKCFYYAFNVRPISSENREEWDTRTEYCQFSEPFNSYLYCEDWVELLVACINQRLVTKADAKKALDSSTRLAIPEIALKPT